MSFFYFFLREEKEPPDIGDGRVFSCFSFDTTFGLLATRIEVLVHLALAPRRRAVTRHGAGGAYRVLCAQLLRCKPVKRKLCDMKDKKKNSALLLLCGLSTSVL